MLDVGPVCTGFFRMLAVKSKVHKLHKLVQYPTLMLVVGFECSTLNYIFVLVSIKDSEMVATSLDISNSMGMNQQSNVTIKNNWNKERDWRSSTNPTLIHLHNLAALQIHMNKDSFVIL